MDAVLVVDGANWSHALEGGRLRIDYDRLISKLQEATDTKIVGMLYYTAYRTKADLDRRWAFLNYLSNMGWKVQAMPATLSADGHWRDKEVDVAIALDAYEEARSGNIQAIIIGSGDEDFGALFRRLPENVKGYVLSFKDKLSPSLKEVAQVVFMEDLGVLRTMPQRMGSEKRCDW
jgi:uncharacterized LabA/DUF88 family protein